MAEASIREKKSRQYVETYVASAVAIFFFGMEFIVLGTILPILKETMAKNQIALLATLLPLGVLVGSMLFGPIQDNRGYKIVLVSFTAIGIVGLSMLSFSKSFLLTAPAVVLIGISSGALNGSASAIISDISNERNRASNLVVLGLIYCIGSLCTPLAMNALLEKCGYRVPIFATAGLMLFSIIYYCMIDFPVRKREKKVALKDIFALFKEPFLIIFSMVLFFQSALEGLSSNWTAQYLTAPGFGLSYGNALYALSAVMLGLASARVILIFLTRTVKLKYLVYSSMIIVIAGAVVLISARGTFAGIAGSFMIGMGLAITFPGVLGMIGDRYPSVSGTVFSFALVVALAGNTLLNLLTGTLGAESYPFVVIGAVAMLLVFFTVGIFFVKTKP
ncbi:MAG: MFS transporter [Bacteroidales bacterium]|jgi:MFS family permease|nr:MFS transporter [Bacteroidales bacterium]